MVTIDASAIRIDPIRTAYAGRVAALDMLRLDLLHPVISGNKWYKLKNNLELARSGGYQSVLSFGGPHSNHLIATAAAAQMAGLKATGIVRGLPGAQALTPTLANCKRYGMQLVFVSREEYSRKQDTAWLELLQKKYGDPYLIPEGGANEAGRAGAGEIARLIPGGYTHVCVAAGTGTTIAGLRNALAGTVYVLGFAPMKGGRYLEGQLRSVLHSAADDNLRLYDDWHFGGFGKYDATLLDFMNGFFEQTGIPLDMVYTGKMMYGVRSLLDAGAFCPDARLLCIHSGGLQGNRNLGGRLRYADKF